MKKQMTWTGKNGNKMKIEVEYTATMQAKTIDSDGYIIDMGTEPVVESKLTTYVDGKLLDTSYDDEFWGLVTRTQGGVSAEVIRGGRIAFATTDTEHIDEYNKMIAEVIEGGKDEDVKAYEAVKKAASAEKEIAEAKEIVAKAEAQKTIPSDAASCKMERQYNDLNNEGGEGYVPHIIGTTEYNNAKAIINAVEEK